MRMKQSLFTVTVWKSGIWGRDAHRIQAKTGGFQRTWIRWYLHGRRLSFCSLTEKTANIFMDEVSLFLFRASVFWWQCGGATQFSIYSNAKAHSLEGRFYWRFDRVIKLNHHHLNDGRNTYTSTNQVYWRYNDWNESPISSVENWNFVFGTLTSGRGLGVKELIDSPSVADFLFTQFLWMVEIINSDSTLCNFQFAQIRQSLVNG